MSQARDEIVRSIYAAFNRRDWDAAFRDQHPDVELLLPPGAINKQTHRGREEIQAYWEDMMSPFETVSAEPERLIESGDQLVAIVRVRVRPKSSSAEIEIRIGHLWKFRGDKTVAMRLFPEPDGALGAAGIEQ